MEFRGLKVVLREREDPNWELIVGINSILTVANWRYLSVLPGVHLEKKKKNPRSLSFSVLITNIFLIIVLSKGFGCVGHIYQHKINFPIINAVSHSYHHPCKQPKVLHRRNTGMFCESRDHIGHFPVL